MIISSAVDWRSGPAHSKGMRTNTLTVKTVTAVKPSAETLLEAARRAGDYLTVAVLERRLANAEAEHTYGYGRTA